MLKKLLDADLGFTLRHWREPSYDLWEEELGAHYYTRLVQQAALGAGARWHEASGDLTRAQQEREAAQGISSGLADYWSASKGFISSRREVSSGAAEKDLDIAVILAVLHAGQKDGAQSILDPRVLATLARLEDLFRSLYPINHGCGEGRAPALGRYAGDIYYSGGAYYFSTLGAAEFHYRLAEAVAGGATLSVTSENELVLHALLSRLPAGKTRIYGPLEAYLATPDGRAHLFDGLVSHGDAFMATVATFAPASGELAEQFDQATGAPASAKNLAWSHAAFITAHASRKAALRAAAAAAAAGTA